MAFYSVRFNDQGDEIETTRKTYRNIGDYTFSDTMSIRSSNQDNNWQVGQTCRSSMNTFRTVRYVNAATVIEKDTLPEPSFSRLDELPECEDASSDASSIPSTRSDLPSEIHLELNPGEEHIPNLELNSNESFPTSDNLTYSYKRVCEASKIIEKGEAYQEWLAAKRASLLHKLELERKRHEQEEERKQERKRLAEEKYKKWLESKAKASALTKNDKKGSLGSRIINTTDKLTAESNFQAWLERKKSQSKLFQEKHQEERRRAEEEKMKRQEEAAQVYEDWLKTAPQKPKPVPLNQGVVTLKGSVSSIYVNPNPWVSGDSE